jgi:hypothetical protein
MGLLGRARALLGVALGDVLPEEKLVSSVRWTGRALRIAQHLGDPGLLCHALRVHGNELRKAGRKAAAAARLRHAADVAAGAERGPALIQLARASADLGNAGVFDAAVADLRRIIDTAEPTPVVNPFVLREVRLRGLLATGRLRDATELAAGDTPDADGEPRAPIRSMTWTCCATAPCRICSAGSGHRPRWGRSCARLPGGMCGSWRR